MAFYTYRTVYKVVFTKKILDTRDTACDTQSHQLRYSRFLAAFSFKIQTAKGRTYVLINV